ncbi:MAG: Uma2 family endonuclease, partial [Thermomicrobiales bacterium]|nr:Uma2 family endonuclease [Thermomicrobiales bacterium]
AHARANRLGRVYGADSGFVLFPDQETVRSPDAAFVSYEQFPSDERPRGFLRLAPDLAVEVLSPSDRIADALAKIAMHLDAGVRLVWLIDPARRSVTAFTPDAPPTVLPPGATLDGGEVLPGFAVPVADLFA